jgi:hypothetical protein
MFEAIVELSIVDFSIVEVEKALVDEIFYYVIPEVDAVFVLFYVRRLDKNPTSDD